MVGIYPTTAQPAPGDYAWPSLKALCAQVEAEAIAEDDARTAEARRLQEAEDSAKSHAHTHNVSETDADATPWL